MLRHRALPVVVLGLLAVAMLGTTALYAQQQPDVYQSRAVLALTPQEPSLGADNLQFTTAALAAYLTSPGTLATVADQLGEDAPALTEATETSIQPNTVNVVIDVTMRDRTRAAASANALAALGLQRAHGYSLVTVELIVPAIPASEPTGPNRMLILLGGAAATVVVLLIAGAALGYLRFGNPSAPTLWGRSRTLLTRLAGR
jgi:hypothetical protein